MSEYAIRTYELTKQHGKNASVDHVNLEVVRGSITALVGPNGAGKTTTIKMLLGLVSPTSGRAEVLDMDPAKDGAKLRARVGFVPETQSLYGYMTAGELLRFCSRLHERWDSEIVNEYVDRFELPMRKRIRDFSQGMKVQLSLITALAHRPELLILDEPFNGLDPIVTRRFLEAILDEVGQRGQSVLITTHLLYQMERVADIVCIMDRGRLVLSRPMDDIKLNEKKVRIAFQADPPEWVFTLPGVAGVEKDGRRCVFHVADRLEEIVAELERIPHFVLEVIDLSLEDVFMEYTSGGRSDDRPSHDRPVHDRPSHVGPLHDGPSDGGRPDDSQLSGKSHGQQLHRDHSHKDGGDK